MKNILFLFLLICNLSFAQSEWVGNLEFSEYGQDITRSLQNQQVLSHGAGFTVFDSLGNIVYNDGLGFYKRSELVELNDTSFLLFAEFFSCDLLVAEIIKFDKDWNMSWNSNAPFNVWQVDNFSDNSLLVFADSLQRMDVNGTIIWSLFPNYNILDIAITASDTIILATSSGLIVLDEHGNIDAVHNDLKFDHLSLMPNGNFLAQSNDTLKLLSPDFQQIASFSQTGIVDVSYDDAGIYLIANGATVYALNESLSLTSSFQPVGHNQNFYAISPTKQGVLLGGTEKFGNNGASNVGTFIKFFELDGTTVATLEDAALLSVEKGSSPTIEWGTFYTSVTIHDIKAEVKNNGNLPLNEVNINMDFGVLYIPFDCPLDQRFSKHFENLNLLPGEDTLLNWGDQKLWFAGIAPSTIDLCLWTSLPNHHLETNNDNDVACAQVTVATKERNLVNFSQSFNPSSDELQLDLSDFFENEKTEARIFNAAGKLVHTETVAAQRQTLGLGNLPDGAYFLQILSGQRVGWGKFAKY